MRRPGHLQARQRSKRGGSRSAGTFKCEGGEALREEHTGRGVHVMNLRIGPPKLAACRAEASTHLPAK